MWVPSSSWSSPLINSAGSSNYFLMTCSINTLLRDYLKRKTNSIITIQIPVYCIWPLNCFMQVSWLWLLEHPVTFTNIAHYKQCLQTATEPRNVTLSTGNRLANYNEFVKEILKWHTSGQCFAEQQMHNLWILEKLSKRLQLPPKTKEAVQTSSLCNSNSCFPLLLTTSSSFLVLQ